MIRDIKTNEMIFTYGDAIEAISTASKGNEYYYVCKEVNGVPQYETYENIVWSDTNTDSKPSEEDVKAKFIEIKTEYDAKQYQRDRDYPSIGEQLDLQYWDKKNGTKKWEEAIDKVKADHPKG